MSIGELLIEGSHVTEEYGVPTSATAPIVVTVQATSMGGYFVAALASPLVPQAGDALDSSTPNLICVRRTPKILGLSTGLFRHVQVVCEYELQRSSIQAVPIRGGASLTQITTQRVRDWDADGAPWVDLKLKYKDDEIGAEITVPDIRGHFAIETTEATNDPWALAEEWVNHINSDGWKGGESSEWLCADVQFRQLNINANPKTWTFQYEFERNPKGHVYTVAYKNVDGNIPEDVVTVNPVTQPITADGGIKTVLWHTGRTFGDKFA